MGRANIQEFLRENPTCYYSAKTISIRLDVRDVKVARILKTLRKTNFVKVIYTGVKRGPYPERLYQYTRGIEMIEELMQEVERIRNESSQEMSRTMILDLLILRELRILNQTK